VVTCSTCGTENRPGRRFCAQCGTALAVICHACGAENEAGDRFCGECGTALVPLAAQAPEDAPAASVSERRLVSVLFADLVGFTSLSEHRDPEEVRELLSEYFERCRTLIERYGGTVEKFIGDAVMAVWGTPVAREDDAERSVRAALALTQAVTLLGEEVGMPELRVRAGVLTGSAAVEVGSESEGMVLGDTVNTASRLQSIAAPGTVLVDDVTRRASEAAIAYEDTGEHQVKGRDQPVRAWTALRVVAGAGGARRGAGLEAPFVGRDRELQTVIEAFETSASSRHARLVTVTGEAGTGKSRLLWEYFKYIDGGERLVSWHQGRCLSYGDGVAYWALAEMVRARAGITEEERPDSARDKLRDTVTRWVPDERERRLVEPRLAHLLGLEQRIASDRADLFSGWRLFFERMSEEAPVVLVFEDMQWADSGLLEFIDYLLEWSAERPLFVLALGRPELMDSRPGWGPDAIALAALPDAAMQDLFEGLAPGLPEELADRVLARAEGIPLYAVETVRMLLDRGLLVQEGNRYQVTGDVDELDVPETLHALAAARLDGLTASERAMLQDGAVYGQSFTPAGVAALGERPTERVVAILDGLVEAVETANREFGRGPVVARAIALNAFGRPAEALETALPIALSGVATANEDRREAYIEAGHSALALDDESTVERLISFVAELPPSMRSPLLRASAARFSGLLAQRRGDPRAAEERLVTAERELREIGAAFFLAQVLVEQAELLRCADRDDDAAPLLAEATATFERLGAAPWLQRARADAAEIAA
jgi:class 3 adenylate cyclase